MILIRKTFSFENLLWTQRAVLENLPNFLTRSTKIISSKSETDRCIFFWWEKSFLNKNLWNRRGQFRQTSPFFVSKVWKVTAHSPKIKKLINIPTSSFSEIGSSGHFWIQIGQPYKKVLCNKPPTKVAWNPWMWSADFNQKNFPKTPFGRVKCVIDNPAENSAHEVQKLLLGA